MADPNPTTDKTPIKDFLTPITNTLQEPTLYKLSHELSKTYKDLAANSTEQFFPTPITHLPTGKERGRYLAVYVGLFYLHVGFIELLGYDDQNTQEEKKGHRRWFSVRRTLEKAWPIEERLKLENPVEFFAWIGTCIAEVVGDSLSSSSITNEKGVEEERELVAGISFCFPIVQKSLDEAVLLPTGKGFQLNSNLNLRQALLDGYECHIRPQSPENESNQWNDFIRHDDDEGGRTSKRRKHFSLPKLKIAAMTNDTVATFASLAYSIKSLHIPNSRVVMGLMVGAGSNATVAMKVSDLHPSKTEFFATTAVSEKDGREGRTETLVSTEWTLLRSSKPLLDMHILTKWDKIVEESSKPPGFQPMEYIVGGRYMGELVRLIVLDYFTNILNIPTDVLPWRLLETGGLTTDFLSLNVASSPSTADAGTDRGEDDPLAKELNQRLPSAKGWTWNTEKANILRTVAYAVMSRSAAVIAAATVGLLSCVGEISLNDPTATKSKDAVEDDLKDEKWDKGPEELVVAFCGGVIQNYPSYKENLQRYIDRLLVHGGPQQGGKSILLREVSDGGIIGVGVLAGTVMGRIEGIVGSKLYDT
ncbi:hexokinase, putative [Talaromyces stipitatus ATCC 10500]|uniref:Phosphotransferase n=1 Tax=Talaromyces stipitatus (strain ATCC 10500 / CBS 375.48 / QM 6759 / NRRL 1006) TaxID=441959 RepID=B8MQL9_TALSN|nr:hexokinase, putative [Talaromyces stipitatus ATCC 10500]EED13442.1 hexokinase, putative [Talaromyces stipitatus ATCC 10500]